MKPLIILRNHSSSIINYFIPAAIFIFCFVFRFIFIDTRDISIDEPFSLFHAQQDLKHIFNLSTAGEPNTPLFLVLLHFWIKIFGYNATFLRILPLLFNSLTAMVIYLTGKRFFDYKSGIAASLIFIFSFSQFFHGLELRSYSMFTLAVALSLYYFLKLINTNDKTSVIQLVISNLFVVYSHYFGWFVIFSEGIGLLLYFKNRKVFWRIIASLFLTVLGFAPMIKIIIRQFFKSSKGTWLSAPSNSDFKKELLFLFNHDSIFVAFKIILVLGVVLLLLRYLKYRQWNLNIDKKYLILILWSIFPFTLMFFVSSRIPVFTGRYILYTAPGFYLLAITTISILLNRYKIIEYLAFATIIVLMAFHLRILPKDFGWRDIRKTSEYIRQSETKLDKRIIIVYPAWNDLEFIFHYDLNLFKSYNDFDARCKKEGIRKAWSVKQIKELSEQFKNNDIVLLTNTGTEETAQADSTLNLTHSNISKAKFPEFYFVGIYSSRN